MIIILTLTLNFIITSNVSMPIHRAYYEPVYHKIHHCSNSLDDDYVCNGEKFAVQSGGI